MGEQKFMQAEKRNKAKLSPARCNVVAVQGIPNDSDGESTISTTVDVDETLSEDSDIVRESRVSAHQSYTAAVMMNIPLEYTREQLLEFIDQEGFRGLYELFYLPHSFQTELNHGYAFIDFTTTENFEKFREHFHGFRDWNLPSDKTCDVTVSDRFNSLGDHIEAYRNSPIMHESVQERFRPLLFQHGERICFPKPTKKIKAPRCKKICSSDEV